jgi:molecular chaperone DnaK (HSP70)
VTVPVYFNEAERQAVVDAASIAGLRVLSIVDQGTALALTYGNEQTFNPGTPEHCFHLSFGRIYVSFLCLCP